MFSIICVKRINLFSKKKEVNKNLKFQRRYYQISKIVLFFWGNFIIYFDSFLQRKIRNVPY